MHVSVRLGDTTGCVCWWSSGSADGTKELLAVEDGFPVDRVVGELMRDLKARGLNAPKLVCGDGALGLWGTLRDVFPTRPNSAAGCTMPIRRAACGARKGRWRSGLDS